MPSPSLRVAVTGATGNVGSAVVRALVAEPSVSEIVAIARRRPEALAPSVRFVAADVASDNLRPAFEGVDAVVHLAWLIQPGRDESVTARVNVTGSRRVFEAAAAAGVSALVHASSVGVYSPGPKDPPVDEAWRTDGIASSFYSRHKAQAERDLDRVEAEHPALRVVRLRPGLIFQRGAATEIRRLFVGPLLPTTLMRPELVPVMPDVPGLRVQAVHADDVADAYRRAVVGDVRGAFNIAAGPVIDTRLIATMLGARPVRTDPRVLRGLAAGAFALRLSPTEPGWLDLALQTPLMSTRRAREELGWTPRRPADDALRELAAGMRDEAELTTPPLARATSGPLRLREFLTGIGRRV
jgi:UDP-glucose 4-epimerase